MGATFIRGGLFGRFTAHRLWLGAILGIAAQPADRVCDCAGIEKHLTSHTARRTYCTLAEKAGVPRGVVMRISGHHTEKDYLLYTGISFEYNADMMRRANPGMFAIKTAG